VKDERFEDLRVDGRIILKMNLKEIGWKDAGWNYLTVDRDKWWVVPVAVVSLNRFHKMGNFLTS
jgi:hypothetical protein